MAKKKGRAAANAKNAKLLKSLNNKLPTKNSVKNSVLETVKDIAGVVIGGFAGAAIGKPSLAIGIGLTGAGHFTNTPLLTSFGVGVMASNGFQGGKGTDGLDGMDMASVKERINNYKENLLQKTYIDKILPKKEEATKATNGIGDLQFFTHSNDYRSGITSGNDDFAGMNTIEENVIQSGMAHMRNNNIQGMDDIEGVDGNDDYTLTDARDYNF